MDILLDINEDTFCISDTHFNHKNILEFEKCRLKHMISHHGPSTDAILKKYKDDPITCFYYFDGKKDIDRIKPKVWIHGHSHGYYEHTYNNCDIYCNAIGYPSDDQGNTIKTIVLT